MATALNANALLPWMSIEVADCNAIFINHDEVSFNVNPQTKKIHNGIRAEVSVNYPFNEGDTVTYSVELKLPKNFKGDVPKNRWWIIAQWHDQPDPRLHESWADFPKRSPPVSIYIEENNGKVGIGVEVWNQQQPNHPQKSWFALPLDEWLTLNTTIHWSTKSDGWVKLNISNQPNINININGLNKHNAFAHYFKMGQYRHPDIKALSTVYFRNLSIATLKNNAH